MSRPEHADEPHELAPAPDDGLFGLAGATEGTTQWRLESLQVVNWGGFEGHHLVELDREATLITGASGVGKSSLLDAWTTLMMPSDTRLNSASNDMASGRARSAGQRSPVSYVRGVVDQAEDPTGSHSRTVSLRGNDADTWGAVGATFVDDRGRRFSALRTFYVPRSATVTSKVPRSMATLEDRIDLGELERIARSRFTPAALRGLYPGLEVHGSYQEFSGALFDRLGIGANGDGTKALRLLAQIQASKPVRSVDELYKEMVLERPATFEKADQALAHFDALEANYDEMVTEQQRADLLAPLTEYHQRLTGAQDRIAELDAYGATRTGATPLRIFELRTRADLLTGAVAANRAQRDANAAERAEAERRLADLKGDLATARHSHREAGGERLELLGAEVDKERARATSLAERRQRLEDRTRALGPALGEALDDAAAYARAQEEARALLDDVPDRLEELRPAEEDAARRLYALQQQRSELRADRDSLAGRHGRVPRELDQVRRAVASAAGLGPEELPFLAELIDLAEDQAEWRTAVETVLGSEARHLLVPLERLAQFRAAVDRLDLPRRIQFIGAEAGLDPAAVPTAPTDRIAGKLLYAEHPYAGWVRAHLAEGPGQARCVEDAAALGGAGLRVTRAGQTSSGHRGAHGRGSRLSIIGFSNADALAELDAALERLADELDTVEDERAELRERRRDLEEARAAHQALLDVPWADIDVPSSRRRLAALEQQLDSVVSADDQLRSLEELVSGLAGQVREQDIALVRLKDAAATLNQAHAALVEAEDQTHDELERIERDGRVRLSAEQAAALDAELRDEVGAEAAGRLDRFEENCGRLRTRLARSAQEATERIDSASRELCRVFAQFQERWPDPNLGVSVASYPDYLQILAEINRVGLPQRREAWQRRLALWSGQDLVPLAGAMRAAIDEIDDRLDPINQILRQLPFGAGGDRLKIRLDRRPPAEVTRFRAELDEVSADVAEDLDPEQLEERFRKLRAFMAQLRRADDPRATPRARARELLLDVRKHVEVRAERYDALTGQHLAVYRTLGEKSGGESQELVAFIIGAALRFRLGDDMRARPRFAPVMLDEGFVKADSEFAGRAVQAWKGLGFQLVVAVPLDKVSGLRRHLNVYLQVRKQGSVPRASVARIVPVEPGAGPSVEPSGVPAAAASPR